ncbi:MAG: class I SAM-dependent methyltransferase [Halioglobus sp.]|nr:class I SAM-dependent methyltransferase [Halioglobus sp.]
MKYYFVKLARMINPFAFLNPEGDEGIRVMGHREYIGGHWDEIGALQFDFLKSKGLQPQNYLLDIACGSLRLGVKAIPYLEPGHYLGIEKESGLVEAGLNEELDHDLREMKLPQIVISDAFEFSKLEQRADFAIAQSLFSHLPPDMINNCFRKLHPTMAEGGIFYATYFEVDSVRKNPDKPHDHGYFAYTRSEMLTFGENNDFVSRYIGDWNHPRGQVVVEYRKV